MRRIRLLLFLALAVVVLVSSGCTAGGATVAERRAEILQMRDTTMADLYRERPDLRSHVESAAGYGAFSNVGGHFLLVGGSGGYGVVVDNATAEETYMRVGGANIGVGLGVKDFRAVFVFKTEEALNQFVWSGWEFAASASAAAKSEDRGGAATATRSLDDDVEIYRMTVAGLEAVADVGGTRYWRDEDLN